MDYCRRHDEEHGNRRCRLCLSEGDDAQHLLVSLALYGDADVYAALFAGEDVTDMSDLYGWIHTQKQVIGRLSLYVSTIF